MQKRAFKPNDLCGDYRVVRLLALGGPFEVYEAVRADTEHPVMLKCLKRRFARDERERQRMIAEAKLLSGIRHPNVIHIEASGDHEGIPWMATEHVAGTTLRARISASKAPFTVAVALCFVRQIVDAMGAMHTAGSVHGDLRPEDILLTDIDEVKLFHLGAVESLKQNERKERPTTVASVEPYAAPELLRGARPDERTDVYAAGVILYEMLAGGPSFAFTHRGIPSPDAEAEPDAAAAATATASALPLTLAIPRPDFPPYVWQVVTTAIAESPGDRFGSMEAFGEAINEAWNLLLQNNRAGAELRAALSLLTEALQAKHPSLVDDSDAMGELLESDSAGFPLEPAADTDMLLRSLLDALEASGDLEADPDAQSDKSSSELERDDER